LISPAGIWWITGAALLLFVWLVYRYSLFVPAPQGLPILLYHKVSPQENDALTISADRLDRQLAFIKDQNYTAISFSELSDALNHGHDLPAKPILVTFDDAYLRTVQLVHPLLLKHQVKATILLPVGFIGGVNQWDGANESLMSYQDIQEIAGGQIEFGLHSCRHENYEHYSAAQIEADVTACVRALEEQGCPFTRVFAYPYGRMPREQSVNQAMRNCFRKHGIEFALRIGSRINRLPPKDPYELKRIAIRGTDSFWTFKTKLRKGRVKLF
jgi:peptidoglycan/xylan/chitin deacetylase (PgdA/CDA1 family)